MTLLIGFTGPPSSGKNTAADYLEAHHDFRQVAFADAIRQAVLTLDPWVDTFYRLREVVRAWGWETAKRNSPEVRRLLQVFGTEVGRAMFGTAVWVDQVCKKIATFPPGQRAVITDVRFSNEADALWARGGFLGRIKRDASHHRGVLDHRSETESAALVPDYHLPNHTSTEELHRRLDRLVTRLSKQRRHA